MSWMGGHPWPRPYQPPPRESWLIRRWRLEPFILATGEALGVPAQMASRCFVRRSTAILEARLLCGVLAGVRVIDRQTGEVVWSPC